MREADEGGGKQGENQVWVVSFRTLAAQFWGSGTREREARERVRKKLRCPDQVLLPDNPPPTEWPHPGTWASSTGSTLLFLLEIK